MSAQVDRAIRQQALFQQGQSILVAVSGGVDSMVLLDVLHQLAPGYGWKLKIAHLNHRLRGRSSDADERLVRRTAARLRLPIVVERVNVRAFAREQRLSTEMAARKVRHEFLARTALRCHCPSIALAHHADDQLELFFLRLLRGAGSEGLAGMKWSSPSPARRELQLVRPLLNQPKGAFYEYAASKQLQFREDATNTSLDIQRNRVRHELLPLLREHYQPALNKTVLRTMEQLRAESDFVRDAASAWLAEREGRPRPFEKLPAAVQRRCLQLQLLQLGVSPEFDLIEQLRGLAGHPVCVSAGWLERDSNGRVRLQAKPPQMPTSGARLSSAAAATTRSRARTVRTQAPFGRATTEDSHAPHQSDVPTRPALTLRLRGRAGEARYDGATIDWKLLSQAPQRALTQRPGQELFDADRVGPEIRLRHWRTGDRFQPIGMRSPVKLQDIFTNLKVPRARRHQLLLAETPKMGIFWVEGLRIGEHFKLTNRTIRRLQWRWQRL